MQHRVWPVLWLAASAVFQAAQPAAAQEAGPTANTVIYDPLAFPEAANAEDLLRRIPGVQAIIDSSGETQAERGFGSGGTQILLGGKRFPGKSNEIIANLRRIPTKSVARVELISGATSGVSVQSQGMMVNVILREGASAGGAGSYELNGRFNDTGWFGVDGQIAYTRAFGALTLSGGVERNKWSPAAQYAGVVRWTDRTRNEVYYYPNGAIQELRPQEWFRRHNKWSYTGAANYAFENGDTLDVNALYERRRIAEYDVTKLTRFSPTGQEILRATEFHQRIFKPYYLKELSVGYASGIGPGTFNGLLITRRVRSPAADTRTVVEPTRTVEISRSDASTKTGEDIVRGAYTFPLPGGGKSLELGAEIARNTLAQQLDVFLDFNNDGKLEPAVMPIDEPEVEELRGETFANFKWQVTARLSLDAALNYEYSRLTTNYPFQPKRTLGFFKPRADLRYRPSPLVQYRMLVERKVGQLDFNNFVPRYNFVDDRVEAGNPGLEPEKLWIYQVGYERRLPQDGGVVDVRLFYEDSTDTIDKVPLRQGGFLVSASGNIPKAKLYGAEAKASMRLGFLGLPAAQLNLRGLRQDSSVKDPFTGLKRRLNDDRIYAYDIGFRHDLKAWAASYGFTYRATGDAAINSDLLVTEYTTIDPVLEVFAERALGGMTLRLELQNLTHSHERRWRQLYQVNHIDGRVRRSDFYEERRDIRGSLRLRGKF